MGNRLDKLQNMVNELACEGRLLAINIMFESARAEGQAGPYGASAVEVESLVQRCAQVARHIEQLVDGQLQEWNRHPGRDDELEGPLAELSAAFEQVASLGAVLANKGCGPQGQIDQIKAALSGLGSAIDSSPSTGPVERRAAARPWHDTGSLQVPGDPAATKAPPAIGLHK